MQELQNFIDKGFLCGLNAHSLTAHIKSARTSLN